MARPREYPEMSLNDQEVEQIKNVLSVPPHKVYIRDVCELSVRNTKKHISYHNFSKKEIVVPAKKRLHSKVVGKMKEFINNIK